MAIPKISFSSVRLTFPPRPSSGRVASTPLLRKEPTHTKFASVIRAVDRFTKSSPVVQRPEDYLTVVALNRFARDLAKTSSSGIEPEVKEITANTARDFILSMIESGQNMMPLANFMGPLREKIKDLAPDKVLSRIEKRLSAEVNAGDVPSFFLDLRPFDNAPVSIEWLIRYLEERLALDEEEIGKVKTTLSKVVDLGKRRFLSPDNIESLLTNLKSQEDDIFGFPARMIETILQEVESRKIKPISIPPLDISQLFRVGTLDLNDTGINALFMDLADEVGLNLPYEQRRSMINITEERDIPFVLLEPEQLNNIGTELKHRKAESKEIGINFNLWGFYAPKEPSDKAAEYETLVKTFFILPSYIREEKETSDTTIGFRVFAYKEFEKFRRVVATLNDKVVNGNF